MKTRGILQPELNITDIIGRCGSDWPGSVGQHLSFTVALFGFGQHPRRGWMNTGETDHTRTGCSVNATSDPAAPRDCAIENARLRRFGFIGSFAVFTSLLPGHVHSNDPRQGPPLPWPLTRERRLLVRQWPPIPLRSVCNHRRYRAEAYVRPTRR